MNKFNLNVVSPEAPELTTFFNISEERLNTLQQKTNEAFNAQEGSGTTCTGTVLAQVVPVCETLEEVVMVSYAIGGIFQKKQSRNPLAALLAALG